MVGVTQINLIVADLDRSRAFYAALGCQLRSIVTPGDETPRAWEVTAGFAPVGLHTAEFARWWDSSAPASGPGSTTIDITFDGRTDAVGFVEVIRTSGGQVLQELTNMPWGQSYAICADPDGYRWGIKTAPSEESAP
ncbi:MAG: VOC family protein [Propioniciclava sp.]|uniref:VOC family protein n=1 Tax=Propioniciclava sp. TaxID=2038686 RepID=UPI0039E58634